jgi:hypothetical protein
MNTLKIAIRDNRTLFRPGEEIVGAVAWQLDQAPRTVELRLFWFTRGKGTSDVKVVQTVSFDSPKLEEARPFQLAAPTEPYSFSGKLISLIWALELVVAPGKETERLEIVISPTAEEIVLHKSDQDTDTAAARCDGTHG